MAVNLKKLVKKEWHIEHADACPAFTEMAGFHFTRQLCRPIPAYKIVLGFYKNKEADWMTLASDQQKIGKSIIQAFLKNKKLLDNYYRKWTNNFDLMRNFYYRKFEENVKSLADGELWKWADDVYNFYRKKISFPAFIDGFMFYADKRLDNLLQEFCEEKKISDYPKIFSVLIAPVEPSFIYEEGRELEKIVNAMVKSGLKRKQNLKIFLKNRKNKRFFNLIHNHLLKYSWIKSSYAGFKQYAISDVQNEIDKVTAKSKQEELRNIFYQNQLAKKQLIKKYKFTPEITAITKITEKFTRWQEQRKIYTLTFVTLQEKILREISRRAGINLELLRYCRISDLSKVLRRKFKGKELRNRQKSSLFVYKEGRIANVFIGKKTKKFFQEASEIKIKEVKEIKGITASLGKAKGAAKVVKTAKYISKIKEGDILIAPMTRPEYLAGVKRASAIITDDGGITCHAAIISRELGIPCIIGTKIATKILKDGDLVEVDANKGIVKILKKV